MKTKPFQYIAFVKRLALLCVIPWLVPLVHIITREESDPFEWKYIAFAVAFIVLTISIMYVARRVLLGYLFAYELDTEQVYELDKRPDNQKHNLKLSMNHCFYAGDFDKLVLIYEDLISLRLKPMELYEMRHTKILADFLCDNTDDILTSIAQQEQLEKQEKLKIGNERIYYEFIKLYLQGENTEAIDAISSLLREKHIEVMNHRRVLVYYLMLMAFQRNADEEKIQTCKDMILQSDRMHRTIFSKYILE